MLFREFDILPVGGMSEGEKHPYMVPVVPKNGIVVRAKRRAQGA